jgi:hypothetical protein
VLKHPVIFNVNYFIGVASHQLPLALLHLVHSKPLLAADAVRQPDPIKRRIIAELDPPAAAAATATLAQQQQQLRHNMHHITGVSSSKQTCTQLQPSQQVCRVSCPGKTTGAARSERQHI